MERAPKETVQDAIRIMVYEKENGVWSDKPSGYVNLLKIREENFLPENTNGIKTLVALTPEGMS